MSNRSLYKVVTGEWFENHEKVIKLLLSISVIRNICDYID